MKLINFFSNHRENEIKGVSWKTLPKVLKVILTCITIMIFYPRHVLLTLTNFLYLLTKSYYWLFCLLTVFISDNFSPLLHEIYVFMSVNCDVNVIRFQQKHCFQCRNQEKYCKKNWVSFTTSCTSYTTRREKVSGHLLVVVGGWLLING